MKTKIDWGCSRSGSDATVGASWTHETVRVGPSRAVGKIRAKSVIAMGRRGHRCLAVAR
jgi:hypothetical protein